MAIDKQNPQLTSGEKAAAKKLKHKLFISQADPKKSAANKLASDAKRARRKEEGTTKEFK